ncbi:MAG: hypothetical protein AB2687_24335 [Candidatus Thiodiazotropha taylori]
MTLSAMLLYDLKAGNSNNSGKNGVAADSSWIYLAQGSIDDNSTNGGIVTFPTIRSNQTLRRLSQVLYLIEK